MIPELWMEETRDDSVVVLNIPGLVGRPREFDLDVSLLVNVPADAGSAGAVWHELTLEVDGRRQWSRRIQSHNPGETDGLDYHMRLRLEPGQALRLRAMAGCKGARVRHLQIEAREDLPS